ncbi:MAG: 4-hydroxythreonine-4-phosphate dehydrogenase PdxA [Pirellulales bacterium]|nr:4-hydroxythreonine-4-phosphate dehydrogenase PdxA [Pirellulales bacterium]
MIDTPHDLPRIAVTMGDPSGVGPEIIVRALSCRGIGSLCRPIVIGHPEIMHRAVQRFAPAIRIREVTSLEDYFEQEPADSVKSIACLSVCNDGVLDTPAGTIDARSGHAAFEAISAAIDLALARRIDAIVTAPLCKKSLQLAGHFYPGHTELLAQRCGVAEFAMMLYLPAGDAIRGASGLGVVHVTLHMAICDVVAHLSIDTIASKCLLAERAMRALGADHPRIAVCALNPHAGENGLFGDEEQTMIGPAIEKARMAGLEIAGPLPADTLFPAARDGFYDAIVAMYHDQGHIALKLLGMYSAVNITLGLPIIRTSVAHGTAFDRAWQGNAESAGMVAAIKTAAQLVQNHRRSSPCLFSTR